MFNRHSRRFYARIFIALALMQVAIATYACPLIARTMSAAAVDAGHQHAAAMEGCAQPGKGDAENTGLCHQHYAGDQTVGNATLAFTLESTTSAAVVLPVSSLKPIAVQRDVVSPILLRRTTAPPLSIRFQVLRI